MEKDLGRLVDEETETMMEEHWATDCGQVRIRRYAKQGLVFLRGEAGGGRASTKENDCGELGCPAGHQVSCVMSGGRIEKGYGLENGILRRLGRRKRRKRLSGRPRCVGHRRGDLKACGEKKKGQSWMADGVGWRSG